MNNSYSFEVVNKRLSGQRVNPLSSSHDVSNILFRTLCVACDIIIQFITDIFKKKWSRLQYDKFKYFSPTFYLFSRISGKTLYISDGNERVELLITY